MATRIAHDRAGEDAPEGGDLQAITLRVAKVLALIRPAIQRDGGDVELLEVTGTGLVRIRLLGACIGCPSAAMTLKYGIEQNLRDHVPGVTGVEAVE
ncbi:MAG: NifU family protein [Phycisphaerales bacterium]